eukprot:176088_1
MQGAWYPSMSINGHAARYVTCLDPLSPRPISALAHRDANLASHPPSWAEVFMQTDDNGNHHKQLADAKERLPAGEKGKGRRKMIDSFANSGPTANTAVKTVQRKMRWIHIDIVKGVIDKPETVLHQRRFRRHPMPYVVGIDEQGRARDVTRRYHAIGKEWAGVLRARGRMGRIGSLQYCARVILEEGGTWRRMTKNFVGIQSQCLQPSRASPTARCLYCMTSLRKMRY